MNKNSVFRNSFPVIYLLLIEILLSINSCSLNSEIDNVEIKNFPYEYAKTPPMGWSSWNWFHCNINEKIIMETADAMVSTGMKNAGYTYINIDDCWQLYRDDSGIIVADTTTFPSGIKFLSDYIHSKGLKFGIYSSAGLKTCQGRPGSKSYETEDAIQYAQWNVDYLKYDWCYTDDMDPKEAYRKMSIELINTNRPIIFSISPVNSKPWTWAKGIAHLWRTSYDITTCWDCVKNSGSMGWTVILDKQVGLEKYAGPGHWNDPDMLEVGNPALSINESRAQFTMWCMLAAPLIAGNDLRNMSPEVLEILTNTEAIQVDQDTLGIQGSKIIDLGDVEVWSKKLSGDCIAVALLNRGLLENNIHFDFEELNILNQKTFIRDLWKHKDLGIFTDSFESVVQPHDVVFIKISLPD